LFSEPARSSQGRAPKNALAAAWNSHDPPTGTTYMPAWVIVPATRGCAANHTSCPAARHAHAIGIMPRA
jgi:hypothetical protein